MSFPDDRSLRMAMGGAAAGLAYWGPGLAANVAPVRRALGIASQTRDGRGVALTFDDGPHREGTPAMLEVLERRGVSATFFLVGEQIERQPTLPARIVAAGHQVGLHCHRHRNLLRLGPRAVFSDLARATALIEDSCARRPVLYRPPYGVFNLAALTWAHRYGMRPLLWTQWGRDWERRATAASITRRLTDDVAEGAVLLLHDADDYSTPGSWRRTLAALPVVVDELERRRLPVVAA